MIPSETKSARIVWLSVWRSYAAVVSRGDAQSQKREEILEILGECGVELRDLTHYPDAPEVVEDGKTFEENARKKAVELACAPP